MQTSQEFDNLCERRLHILDKKYDRGISTTEQFLLWKLDAKIEKMTPPFVDEKDWKFLITAKSVVNLLDANIPCI